MGFNFGFFGTPNHREFNYKPVYYDPEKEALKERFGAIDGSAKEEAENKQEKKPYVPGQYIKGSLTDRAYRVEKEKKTNKLQKIIGAVALILAFAVIILIAKYFPLIWQ